MTKGPIFSFTLLVSALLPQATVLAADAPLPTVVVIGVTPLQGAELNRNQIAAPVQTATSEDIDRSNAADITAYMNRSMGGVYVNDVQNNPLQPDVNYRGYTASPLLGTPQGLSIYLDGVRLNQPFGDVVSWDLIPRATISSLTLMPGSNPLFGLNTLGGALSLRTKDGFSDPGTSAQLSYGSNQRRAVEAQTGGHTTGGLYWFATGNKLKDDGWRDDSPTDTGQLFGKLGWRDDRTDVSLTASYADTNLTGNGLQEQRFIERDYDSVYTKPDNTRNDSRFLNLAAIHEATDNITLSGNAYYRRIRTSTLNGDLNEDAIGQNVYQPGEDATNTPFPSLRCIDNILANERPNEACNGLLNRTGTRQHDGGISAQASLRSMIGSRANVLTLGVTDIRSSSHFMQSSQFGYLTPDRGIATVDGPGAFADGSQDSENAFDARVDLSGDSEVRSVYFANSMQLSGTVHFTVSGRYDHTRIQNRDALTPAGEPGSLDGDHEFSRFNPAVGITFTPSSRVSAYLGYNEGSRAPSSIELGCADPENPCRLPNSMAGDPPLDQVVTKTVEAGVRGEIGEHVQWNAGVFNARNQDDILFVADDQAAFGYFRNFGETRRRGGELGLQAHAGRLTFGANYSFLDATYRTAERVNGEGNSSNDGAAPGFGGNIEIEPGDRIPLTPRHVLKGFAGWAITPTLSLDADVIAIAGSYARGNENNEHEPDGVYYLGPGRTGGYTVVNLGGEYNPTPAVRLFAQLNNVFDREYYTASQLAGTGFNDAGTFVALPFAAPVIDGERPLVHATFYAPGAPRQYWLGMRYTLGK